MKRDYGLREDRGRCETLHWRRQRWRFLNIRDDTLRWRFERAIERGFDAFVDLLVGVTLGSWSCERIALIDAAGGNQPDCEQRRFAARNGKTSGDRRQPPQPQYTSKEVDVAVRSVF